MTDITEVVWCEACGVEITWGAYTVNEHIFCCQDCFEGLPCHCAERMAQFEDERRSNQISVG